MIKILYGTQTWTALTVSQLLAHELKIRRISYQIISLASYTLKDLINENDLIIFIVSTTGDGECPSSFQPFYKSLFRKDLSSTFLNHIHFSVFGLGDSSYPKYNIISKILNKRLLQIGATLFSEKGEDDDQHPEGYYAGYTQWTLKLLPYLEKHYQTQLVMDPLSLLPPIMKIEGQAKEEYDLFNMQKAKVILNECLDPNEQIYKLIVELEQPHLAQPLDILKIQPENHQPELQELFKLLNLDTDMLNKKYIWKIDSKEEIMTQDLLFEMKPLADSLAYQTQISLKTLFRYFLSPFTPLNTPLPLIPLSHFLTSPLHQEKLREMTGLLKNEEQIKGRSEFDSYFSKLKKSIFDFLNDYYLGIHHQISEPIQIPIEYLYNIFNTGGMYARSFSICQILNNKQVEIRYKKIQYKIGKNEHFGLCTNFMSHLKTNDVLYVSRMNAQLEIPKQDSILIGICTGLGLCTIYELLKYRLSRNQKCILFYGCRHWLTDPFHQDLLSLYEQYKSNISIYVAVSRHKEPFMEEIGNQFIIRKAGRGYVQELLEIYLKQIVSRNEKYHVICSGSNNQMPKEVKSLLKELMADINYTYHQECW